MPDRSPLAPPRFPDLPAIPGVTLASAHCGIRNLGKRDLLVASFVPGTSAAAVLTRSRTPSAAVRWCRRVRRSGSARGLIVNSGNANAFTGSEGKASVRLSADAVARQLGGRTGSISPDHVYVASTGVIGEPLPVDRILATLPSVVRNLSPAGWEDAAEAIMTTDTFPKGAAEEATVGDVRVRINGIAKGSGMIAPNMGTMLAFLFTDADLPGPVLDPLLRRAVHGSFNSITVDSDMSTSDTCACFASRTATLSPPVENPHDPRLVDFERALSSVTRNLALQIVRDGEGATKLLQVDIRGARSEARARRVAFAIANSPLVKTAIAGEDPNWGRIVMAAGKAGIALRPDRLAISIGGIPVARGGRVVDDYDEAPVARHMQEPEISLAVNLGEGTENATVWTCDLTHGYIAINADYRS